MRFYDRPETEQSVAVRCETGVGHEVADADFGLRDDRDVAFDAGARRFDLILKRRRNRMGVGDHGQRVFPVRDVRRNIEIGRRFRIRVITGQMPVRIDVISAADGVEPDEYFTVDPFERHRELGTVDGRPCSVALFFGNRDAFPCRNVRRRRGERRVYFRFRTIGFYLPFSVQPLHVERFLIVFGQRQFAAVVTADLNARHFAAGRGAGRVLQFGLRLQSAGAKQAQQREGDNEAVFHNISG